MWHFIGRLKKKYFNNERDRSLKSGGTAFVRLLLKEGIFSSIVNRKTAQSVHKTKQVVNF
jgi:hypothetical protein